MRSERSSRTWRVVAAVGAAGAMIAAAGGQTIPLNYNFNGMVHTGEAGIPDDLTGFRSISDRALLIDGGATSLGTSPIVGNTGLGYSIVATAFTLDVVHLGDRSLHWAYDTELDGDNIGMQPTWQPVADQTGPQITDVSSLALLMQPNSQIGVLYQVSSGGGGFDAVLTFTDASSVTVRLAGPDWFGGTATIPARNPGVSSQARVGGTNATYQGTNNNDMGATAPNPGQNLSVIEGVISVPQMIADGLGSHVGKTLSSISFGNADLPAPSANRGFAVLAATHDGSAVANPTATGSAAPATVALGNTVKLKVAAIPASAPMNAITSVVVDASGLGLSSMLALNDSGTNGDAVAGDSLWTLDVAIPTGAPAGAISLPATVTDEQARTGGASINFTTIAPPALAADLGTLSPGLTTFNGTLEAGTVKWIRFTLASAVDRALLGYFDIDTEGSNITGTTSANNTIIGVYDANGNRLATDDNDGSGFLSQLTYGVQTPARPAAGTSLAYNGRDAAVVPAGTYYLAYAAVTSTFNTTGFNVTTTSAGNGPVTVRFNLGTAPAGGLPAAYTDLGVIASGAPVTSTQALSPGGVRWFRFEIDSDVIGTVTARNYLDIDTEGSAIGDTIMGLFRDNGSGSLVGTDDDDGTATWSQFSYGRGTRPAPGDGLAYNGRDGAGTITAGVYYLAVSEKPAAFAANFVVAYTTGVSSGDVRLNIRRGVQSPVLYGPVNNPANGNNYYLIDIGYSFADAEAAAVSLGGHLASIGSAEENEWARTSVLRYDGVDRRGWIGYTDELLEGTFVWTDGSTDTFTNWAAGEPNNFNNTEHYAEMLGSSGQWNDIAAAGASGGDYGIVEVPGGGACCTGSTCSVTGAGACSGPNTRFVGAGTACNTPGNSTTPCCLADFNQSGLITVQDIFDFLASYFGAAPAADFNQSGAVTVQDIFDYLAGYFGGCN